MLNEKLESKLYLVIIAGGSGTRFWPKSTSKTPKQLLSFDRSQNSLLVQTANRFKNWVPPTQQIVVTTRLLEDAIKNELPHIKILAEPQGRNTAPCIYWAAQEIAKKDPQGIMLVMPADHYIAKPDHFLNTVKNAARWASHNDDLVTLGIKPTRPETGYGYLKTSPHPLESGLSATIRKVDAFVEKPNIEKATQFLQSGNYLWNGGMFVWRAEIILKAFDTLMPEMKKAWNISEGNIEKAYPLMPATSIDYGIMEKANHVVTFPLDCGWDDLGSWTSLESLADHLQARKDQNIITSGELISIDSQDNIIDAPRKLITLLGIENLIIVEHGETLMIAHKSRAQDIRKVVEQVKIKRPDLI